MNGYERVQAAIIAQAIKDYKTALKRKDYYKIKSLEKFFLSKWGEMLSNGNGNYIIELCRKTATIKRNRWVRRNDKDVC